MKLNGVILAGGKSSRMKRDKALLPFRGYKSLASYQYERLKPLFNNLYISAKDNKFEFQAPILYDKTNIYSPLAAIYSILTQLKEDIFIIAVDMPLISIASIKELIDIYSKSSYEIYSFEVDKKAQPTAAIYRYTPLLISQIKSQLEQNNHKLNHLLKNSSTYLLQKPQEEFINLNYPCDYLKFK